MVKGMLLGLLCAALIQPSLAPAFLDGFDSIKVWIPRQVSAGEPLPPATVTVGGRSVEVARVEPAGLIAEAPKPKPGMVVLAGSLQHLFGGADWAPGDHSSEMTEIRAKVYELLLKMPKGRFEYKIAVGGSWNENYGAEFKPGGANLSIEVAKDQTPVRFLVDFATHRLGDSINNPDWVMPPSTAPDPTLVRKLDAANVFRVRLRSPLSPAEVAKPIFLAIDGGPTRTVFARDVLDSPVFSHEADDLGARYSKARTQFKVWCPIASSVNLELEGHSFPMERGADGVWARHADGDLHGQRYRFVIASYGSVHTAPDINGYAATEDGTWSVVRDSSRTNPPGWSQTPLPQIPPTRLTVYEAHIRDFTIDPSSQVPENVRGKYLGFVYETRRQTGLSYLKWLGVNAVQLMPFQMFNPAQRNSYDWGYDTNLFNVPESQYSTNPKDPITTIREAKTMIAGLHHSGIRVIMDVVYNHTVPSEGPGSAFWETVPYYYFRTDDQGKVLNESGVGNAMDDDHPIVRKYVRDSLCYWAREYGVDGFRFDLLGMFRKKSVLDWRAHLDQVRPGIVMYGEPWTGGGPLRFGKGDQRGTHVGVFNDNFRNAIRGDLDGPAPGFAMGGSGQESAIRRGLLGSISDFTDAPDETVNYVSAHDNMTLWDKLSLSMPKADIASRKQSLKLCGALVLYAQGISFLEGGAELGRTKGGNNNTYNAGDGANKFDWTRAKEFMDVAGAYRDLIARRTSGTLAFRTSDEIRKNVLAPQTGPGTVQLRIQTGSQSRLVTFNGSAAPVQLSKPRAIVLPYSCLESAIGEP